MRRRQKKKNNYFIIIIIMLVFFLLSLFLFSKIFNNNTSNSNLSEIEKDINVFTMSDIKNPETILNAVKNVIINIDDKVANTQDIKRDLKSRNITSY